MLEKERRAEPFGVACETIGRGLAFAAMGSPGARVSDYHSCPMTVGVSPHVGGPINSGDPTVLIGGKAAARVGDSCVCVGPADVISTGSATVLIGGKPAARVGDRTAHGGAIRTGHVTVVIGG